MTTVTLSATTVTLTPTGLRTTLPDGTVVHAEVHGTEAEREMARSLGYGDDALAMTRDHDLAHAAVAALLGLPVSPALAAAPYPERWGDPCVAEDEAAAMALQRLARAAGVDLWAAVGGRG